MNSNVARLFQQPILTQKILMLLTDSKIEFRQMNEAIYEKA